ncbi:MAG: hypothetical protein QNJ90_06755 [Planctomycetota bacterium]|nr:hypothetical protein [Planctomycetota bacterium]
MRCPWNVLRALLLISAFGLLTPQVAAEGETADALAKRLVDLTEQVKSHRAAKDMAALGGDLKAAVALHKDADGHKRLRKKVIALIGNLPKKMVGEKLRLDMLAALAQTGDPEGAKYIRFYLKQPNAKKATPLLRAAIRTAGQVPDGSLVSPLLKIVTKSKHMGAASQALTALGNYHGVKTHRAKIMKTVVETVRKSRPGVKGVMKDPVEGDMYNHAGEATHSRWGALSRVLPKMLATLTRNEQFSASVDEWFTMYDDNKRNLKALFVDD